MATRTINLSGTYIIEALSSTQMQLASPIEVNPNWAYADLDGSGTSGYDHNISMITVPETQSVDLSGAGYTVGAVTPTHITLTAPAGVNADWGLLGGFAAGATAALSANVSTTNNGNWIGPFIVEGADTALLVANFVAPAGLYKDNGKKQTAFPITIQLEATPVNSGDVPIGAPQTFSTTVQGNASDRDQRAATLVCELTQGGRQSVRARRTSAADLNFKGTVVDGVKWQDLYGVASVPVSDFGNVTTVHSRTYATEGALAVKDRRLNMLATRLVPIRTSGTSFSAPAATVGAADIFTAACLDPFIGGRVLAELDLDSIYGAIADAVAYFGAAQAGQFSYTFDDDNTSFEETAAIIATAVFCTAFRAGSLIRLALERATEDSALLFNHRNKVPGSEQRAVRFGNLDGNDGVEVEYVNPADDKPATFYLPLDRSATKPRQIKAQGVRNFQQAYWTGWRAWNKIRYQNTTSQFTGLQESAIVGRNTRVLIADNTRPDAQDGEVIGQSGLQLQTSQAVAFAGGAAYTIFLQLPDATIDSIPVSAGPDSHDVVITRAPRVALIFGNDQYALPTYQIVRNDSPRPDAFLIAERDPQDNFTFDIKAVNYSPLYYMNDQLVVWLDFQNGYLDAGPLLFDGTAVGSSAIVTDGTRGKVTQGAGLGDRINLPAFNSPASYTKAFWMRRNNLADVSVIFGSTGTDEFLAIGGGSVVRVSHAHGGADLVIAPWPGAAGEWHHVAATYDATTGYLAIYIDGELAADTTGAARGALGPLHAIGWDGSFGHAGAVDDLRLISRALAPAEILAIYRASKP